MNKDLKVIITSGIGGAMEYYDFVIFVLFAGIISKLFFSNNDSQLFALIVTYTFFAVGYFVRPIGGIILAHFGDKYGRKKVFSFTIFLMAISTFLIGILPTYDNIGILAPMFLLFLRISQGIAVGGEIPGASTFVYEHMAPKNKCTGISILIGSLFCGILLGSLVGTCITNHLSQKALYSWGWRIPFLFGGLLGLVGIYLRSKLSETPIFLEIKKHNQQPKLPIANIIKNHKSAVIASICTTLVLAGSITTFYMYLPNYLVQYYKYDFSTVFTFNSIGLFLLVIFTIGTGIIVDKFKINSKIMFSIGCLILLLFSIPAFYIMGTHNHLYLIIMYIILGIGLGIISAVFVLLLVKIFPHDIRFSGVSTSYNIAFAVFGGLTPLINTLLCENFNFALAPAYYMMLIAVIGLIAVTKIKFLDQKL